MYCTYLRNVKTYEAEIWYSVLIYDADFRYDIDIWTITDKSNQSLWCHHFEDYEKQYLGDEIKF